MGALRLATTIFIVAGACSGAADKTQDEHAGILKDGYRKVHPTITGLPEYAKSGEDYALTCSAPRIPGKATIVWQVAPMGEMRAGHVKCDANSDTTFSCRSTMSFSFTMSDNGNYVACFIELDNGDSIDAPFVRINLALKPSEVMPKQTTATHALEVLDPSMTTITVETSERPSMLPDHVQKQSSATEVQDPSIATTSEKQIEVVAPTQDADSPVVILDRDKGSSILTICIAIAGGLAVLFIVIFGGAFLWKTIYQPNNRPPRYTQVT